MRITFEVGNQTIIRTDRNRIVANSKNYLFADFSFSSDWNGVIKTAIFSKGKKSYSVILDEDNSCLVPWEVLEVGDFSVSVFGGDLITTDSSSIPVIESGYTEGQTPSNPTPDVYQQIIRMIEDITVSGVTDEQIGRAVEEYLEDNPISGVDEDEVQRIVSEYITLNKAELKGEKGDPGLNGNDGADGKSAYDIAVANGFRGSEQEWLESLKGEPGKDGADGTSDNVDEGVIQAAVERYLEDNPTSDSLSGKRILCVGDSICQGVGTNGHPYPYWLQQWHPGANVINLGIGGMTIAQKDSSITNAMPVRIASGEFEEYKSVDVIIFEGGINDLMNNVKLGYISKGVNPTKYKTFCQAMEYMFSYFKGLCPNARMIFISTHNISAYDYNKSQAWWGAASELCAKWGVEFLDLFGLICTPKISGLQLHPGDDVHKDYYAKYIDMALIASAPLTGPRTTNYYKHNVPMMLQFHSGTKQFNTGSSFSTSGWRVNMVRADLTTYVNVSSEVTYDCSDVDNTTPGTYPVHVAYTEDGITLSVDVDVTITEGGGTTKVLDGVSATKTKTDFTLGEVVNTDDITVTALYSDGSTADVTSSASIDVSNANMATAGEYNIAISYTEGNVTKTTQIQISVIESNEEEPDSGGADDEITWDDSATITAAWRSTEGVFENTKITERYTQDQTYNISCKLMVESNSVTSGQVILRLGGVTHDLGTITFGETIEVNAQMKANAAWTTGNMQPNVYTTSGSGFPWTVYIKDFVITE